MEWKIRDLRADLQCRGVSANPIETVGGKRICVDEASGLLQIHSIAPGIYTVYGYSRDLQFHGRTMPDRITIYVRGLAAVDASFEMTDAGNVDPVLVTATPEMIANGPVKFRPWRPNGFRWTCLILSLLRPRFRK